MVAEGTFRSDLFHRLSVVQVRTPPLRNRLDDLPDLAAHLAESFRPGAPLSAAVLDRLAEHAWPGNVRELRNVLERAFALAGGGDVAPQHLDLESAPTIEAGAPATPAPPAQPSTTDGPRTARETEKDLILAALERNYWNQTKAAQELGISRSTLKRRLKEYKLKT
jgi:DNA-binding NtrC family response regulator